MTYSYDPLVPPDPEIWESADEADALSWVLEFHRQAGAELPNERVHAGIHVVVENQALLGDEIPVAATLERLQHEGLDRHDAIHAVGTVLAGIMWELSTGARDEESDPNVAYAEELQELTAASWLEEYGGE